MGFFTSEKGFGSFDIILRLFHEKRSGRAAVEAVEVAIARVDPIDRAMGMNMVPVGQPEGILLVKLGIGILRNWCRLPNAFTRFVWGAAIRPGYCYRAENGYAQNRQPRPRIPCHRLSCAWATPETRRMSVRAVWPIRIMVGFAQLLEGWSAPCFRIIAVIARRHRYRPLRRYQERFFQPYRLPTGRRRLGTAG